MKAYPILFNADMVRAILAGRKTQTRRVIKPQPVGDKVTWGCTAGDGFGFLFDGEDKRRICPYEIGDRLWVRETWFNITGDEPEVRDNLAFRADYPSCLAPKWDTFQPKDSVKWRPSIHMPRWASRITLEVTSVSVKSLHNTSEEDAKAEGVGANWCGDVSSWIPEKHGYINYLESEDGNECISAKDSFCSLWQSIYAKRPGHSWLDNPFVWVIEFTRVQL